VRRGDIVSVARSWERMRAGVASVTAEELGAARAARVALGRAIRAARWRRTHPARVATLTAPTAVLPEAARIPPAAIAVAGVLLVTIVGILVFPRGSSEPAPSAAAPEQVTAPGATNDAGGRGRTFATAAPVAAQATPTAAPTPAPTQAPAPATAAPAARTSAPGAVPGGVPSGVPGGVVGGVPGGSVGGAVGGSGSGTPTPAPTLNVLPATPPPLAVGEYRFFFHVVDSDTRAPLANVCVIQGTFTCGPSDPHTNALGYYWLVIPPGNVSRYGFTFRRDPDYAPRYYETVWQPGTGTTPILVFLPRR